MTSSSRSQRAIVRLLGAPGVSGGQDARTVRLLRLGVGGIGTGLPVAIIAGEWLTGARVLVPSSMSGSYYTSMRNLFVGALCALGVFLIFYRHTERQDRCTFFAGVCALLVAFDPTAPPSPRKEPSWISYVHAGAAIALLFTLGLFCWIVFLGYAQPSGPPDQPLSARMRAWTASIWHTITRSVRDAVYFGAGLVVLAAGGLALYTGIWPTTWSTGWQSCYVFEALAVFAFGTAWITAGIQGVSDAVPQRDSVPRPVALARSRGYSARTSS
jgi:hypothetical protein